MAAEPAERRGFQAQLEQMTQQLLAVERRAKTLAELNRLLSQGQDPIALAQRAVDLVMRATGASGTFAYLWDPDTERLVLRVATTGTQASHVGRIRLRLGEGVTGWSGLMKQTVVISDDILADPRFARFPVLEEEQFRSMVAVPIVVPGGDLLGVFSLYSEQPGAFDKNDVDLATEVGGLLASGLVHAQTLDDLHRQSAAARMLTALPADATSSPQRCVDVLAESIREQAGAAVCVLELADRGVADSHVRPGVACADGVPDPVAAASRSVRSRADLQNLIPRFAAGMEKFATPFGGLFPLGAITCFRTRAFTKADISIMEALAAQAAALIASVGSPVMTIPLAGRLAAAPSPDGAERILRDLGWWGGPAQPVLVRLRAANFAAPSAFDRVVDAVRQLANMLDGAVLVPSAPLLSVLVRYQPDQWKSFEPALHATVRQLRSALGGGVSAGIGPLAGDARQLAPALDGAESALGWADLLGESAPVVHHQDVAHLRLLPRVALEIGEQLREVSTRFNEVIRYDLRHGTALAATLDTYLSRRCSATETAGDLFIHRNTLRQRLGRIEELTGRPVEQFGDWAVASLAARLALAAEPQVSSSAQLRNTAAEA
ncbi:helix-turn-helix domain-containing protein [Amycolatopsis panacis]|uniref:GAF domain-containing protein n=1 Tax=Amycolatopsis panacis TaxID=2340917 RepID=A0A419I7K5_9PSEU|nr:GAF domain-containing protein [Amycolatopsis panacis]RJQ87868.1 GAF domain-containing protein [Amycolatopsis panacis]